MAATSRTLTRLTNEQLNKAFHPPAPPREGDFADKPTYGEAVQQWRAMYALWKQELETLRKEAEAQRMEVEALWKPQRIGVNISYVPPKDQ